MLEFAISTERPQAARLILQLILILGIGFSHIPGTKSRERSNGHCWLCATCLYSNNLLVRHLYIVFPGDGVKGDWEFSGEEL